MLKRNPNRSDKRLTTSVQRLLAELAELAGPDNADLHHLQQVLDRLLL